MRALPAALLALALVPATAPARVGAPGTVRVTRPADERAHPQARTETWELVAADPKGHRTLSIRLQHAEGFPSVSVAVAGGGAPPLRPEIDQGFQSGSMGGARFEGPQGASTAAWRGGRVTVELSDAQVRGRVTLRGRPGVLARRWRLGEAIRYPAGRLEATELNYNALVGSGRLTGTLEVLGERVDLTGWRGSWDHLWGNYLLEDDTWTHWDAYSVHRPGRGGWLAFGFNRSDTVLGPGARDAQWLGVLARVGPRGTRICRPRVDRSRWDFGFDESPSAHRLRARCGRMRVTFADRGDPDDWLRYDGYDFVRQSALPAAAPGFYGVARHQGHIY